MHNQHKIRRVLQLIQLLKAQPPKNIRYLAEVLDSTERTVYRYLDLLTSVGFTVERDEHKRVFINHDTPQTLPSFTEEEIRLLRRLVQSSARKSMLRDGILQKLLLHTDVVHAAEHLLQAHLSAIVDDLQQAMNEKHVVVLKGYHSVHSNTLSDRKVEPIGFTTNLQSLIAFEPASGTTKLFNIERITAVDIKKKRFKPGDSHRQQEVDMFGFARGKKTYSVRLLLNMRSTVLLREKYPLTPPCIVQGAEPDTWVFSASIFDLKPLAHFILGFPDDVRILDGKELKQHILQQVNRILQQ